MPQLLQKEINTMSESPASTFVTHITKRAITTNTVVPGEHEEGCRCEEKQRRNGSSEGNGGDDTYEILASSRLYAARTTKGVVCVILT
jgi:hypothetical protein